MKVNVNNIDKHFGIGSKRKQVLEDVTFEANKGRVIGFLGPNGAGKSTTIKAALNLITLDKGEILYDNERLVTKDIPHNIVYSVINPDSFAKNRSAINHLKSVAALSGISVKRVKECLDEVGLSEVANKNVGKFSLGMKQRLSIATCILSDPKVLIFDEPMNGLDPEGVNWVRNFIKRKAKEGKVIIYSSHILSEVSITADDLVIIGKGKIIMKDSLANLLKGGKDANIVIDTPDGTKLKKAVKAYKNAKIKELSKNEFEVVGIDSKKLLAKLVKEGVEIETFSKKQNLEKIFIELTNSSLEYSKPLTKSNKK